MGALPLSGLSTCTGLSRINSLTGLDLSGLVSSLRGRECIFHGADYDLRLLQRAVGMLPDQIFDTMIAARLAGLEELSLERLTLKLLAQKLSKGPQRANWARRPLTPAMTTYALNDTRYLHPIAELLKTMLKEQGRLSWHEEACQRLIRECAQPQVVDGDKVWRLKGASKLDPIGLTVLREAWTWREEEALRSGLPPFFILPHESLVKIADAAASQRAISGHLPRRFSDRRRKGLNDTIQRALSLPVHERPKALRRTRGKPLTRQQKQEYLALQDKRDRRAEELGIDPSLIASRATLIALALDADKARELLMNWQLGLLNGETG